MASGRGFRPSIQKPRTAPGTRRRGLRRALEGCAANCHCGPLGTLAQDRPALRTTQSTRPGSQKGKGQHAHAVEASKGQRKHPKGAA